MKGAASLAKKIVADVIKIVTGRPIFHCALPTASTYEDVGSSFISPSTDFTKIKLGLAFRTTSTNTAQAKLAIEYIKARDCAWSMALMGKTL
jgi:ABC-type branched-subunit amino acid transport system substrate-binding protein